MDERFAGARKVGISLIFVLLVLSQALAHEWMAPKKDAAIPNPLEATAEVIGAGQQVYERFCLDCHGQDGKGLDPSVTGLDRRPPDLQSTAASHSDGDLFWKINAGRDQMPSFKADLDEQEVWSVIHFIRRLQDH